jgi:hypothetical protein
VLLLFECNHLKKRRGTMNVRFYLNNDQQTDSKNVAKGQGTKSLRSSPLRGGESREA